MFLLDTNIISELRRADKADHNVWAWAKNTPSTQCYLSAISILEIEFGILKVERRDAIQGRMLRKWLEQDVLVHYAQRILPVDQAVARRCAALHIPNRQSECDAMIAATALVHHLTVVTRNTSDFHATGVALLNPFMAEYGVKPIN